MRTALSHRIAKLENGRSQQRANRTLYYNPMNSNGATGALRNVGKGKYMLVANFGSAAEWEAALLSQQRALLTEANRRK
jgi:hypothetical protein